MELSIQTENHVTGGCGGRSQVAEDSPGEASVHEKIGPNTA